jgi:hypothetical protein
MKSIVGTSAALMIVIAAGDSAVAQRTWLDVPVVIGGNAEFDACGGYGEIAGLAAGGDGFLSVRSGPASRHREVDRLRNGAKVFTCGDRGAFIAIVYPADEKRDCGVGSPWPRRRAYTGPCKAGWINSQYLKMLAG